MQQLFYLLIMILRTSITIAVAAWLFTDTVVGSTSTDTSTISTFADTLVTPQSVAPLFVADSSREEEAEDTGGTEGTGIGAPPDTTAARPDSLARQGDSTRLVTTDSIPIVLPEKKRPSWLYPGLSLEQDTLARQMLTFFYDFNWNSADKTAKKLQRLEKKQRLPPLSYLLMVGMRVLRIQFGEYENDHEKKGFLREIEKFSVKGLDLANPDSAPDSCLATHLFITGGIKGFIATLEIDRNPINAALNGLSSVKYLEKAAARDTALLDAYLGLGLFNCVLAKAPLLVRGALALTGNEASLANGLEYLRASAYRGCYTNDIAKLYLAEFLSPYLGDESGEKQKILRSLQKRHPQNPYFVFLELEENLCFHPQQLLSFSFKGRVLKQTRFFKTDNYSTRRYAYLVKWQYLLIDPFPVEEQAPDKNFDLRGFTYYPVFLQALREKIVRESSAADPAETKPDRDRRLRYIKTMGAKAARILDATEHLSSSQKNYYLWHIRDALRIKID
jgi:hypothetical protein